MSENEAGGAEDRAAPAPAGEVFMVYVGKALTVKDTLAHFWRECNSAGTEVYEWHGFAKQLSPAASGRGAIGAIYQFPVILTSDGKLRSVSGEGKYIGRFADNAQVLEWQVESERYETQKRLKSQAASEQRDMVKEALAPIKAIMAGTDRIGRRAITAMILLELER